MYVCLNEAVPLMAKYCEEMLADGIRAEMPSDEQGAMP